ncbi:MAG TPA: sigma-70 family RNA polymerase sigma factor [Pirellulales bacterium]|jgi:RNA polymerase sigma-70 factor (ECF subfamily)|nr:sigma-70 family RNA polymerase sigma factor [Pirellulales bacterium]
MPTVYDATTQRETALERADHERPDDEIVRRAQAGDRDAFAELIRRFERPALAIAFAVLADGDAAGDAVQDGFVRAWRRLAELRQPERFGAWLCGIVRNLARDEQRRCRRELRVREQAALLAVRGGEADPAAECSRRENDERLAAALAHLDELSRAAVTLRYYEGLSSKKIGEILDLSAAAVDMRLLRARQFLRERLT